MLYQASDALNRHDLDAFLALCDPEVTFISYLTQVEGGGPYRDHEGVRDWWKRLLAIYPDFRGEVEEVQEVGDRTDPEVQRRFSEAIEKRRRIQQVLDAWYRGHGCL